MLTSTVNTDIWLFDYKAYCYFTLTDQAKIHVGAILLLLLLLLLLNVFDDAPVCRHVKDESWARAVTWRTTEMQVSKDEYVITV